MGVRNFNLQRIRVRKMGNIYFRQFLIYNDLRQTVQRIYSASLPWYMGDSNVSILHSLKQLKNFFFTFTPPK